MRPSTFMNAAQHVRECTSTFVNAASTFMNAPALSESSLGEVELDLNAVRIPDEDLHRAVARDDGFSKRDARRGQRGARGVEIHAAKRDVIDVAGARGTGGFRRALDQVDHRLALEVQPVTHRRKRRTIAGAQPEMALVELTRALDIRRADV